MSGLRARRVRRCGRVGYPTREEVRARPELLRAHVPAGWLGSREICGVLGVALAVQAGGCRDEVGPVGKAGVTVDSPAVVAPVFEHGRGLAFFPSGSTLGVVAPPAYVPEEEWLDEWKERAEDGVLLWAEETIAEDRGRAIIAEEMGTTGLNPTQRNVAMEAVIIAGRDSAMEWDWVSEAVQGELRDVSGPLKADLVDPHHRVAVEYVSGPEYLNLGGKITSRRVSLKGVAESTAKAVREHGRGVYFGAFYDPEAQNAAESERLLRLQVRDFVEWLKGQGVI